MKPAFSAVLLAGGKSNRMGRDKALLEIDGVPLWQRQLRLLKSLAPEKIFLAGPERAEWASADCEIIADAQPNVGPLGGLIAAMRLCTTPLLLALAVDLPSMTAVRLRGLLDLCETGRGVIPVTDRLEPLAAIYPIGSLALAEEQLVSCRHSLKELAKRCVHVGLFREHSIPPKETGLFLNLNTPVDLQIAQQTA